MLIYKALLKHGYSNFKLEILEYCDRTNVLDREDYYLKLVKPEYNLLEKAAIELNTNHTALRRCIKKSNSLPRAICNKS